MAVELNNSSVNVWSETDASNTSSPPDGAPAGIYPSSSEGIWRGIMATVKRAWDRANGTITSTGSSNAYVYTPVNTSYPTAYVQGEVYTFKANFANTSAATLNINSLGAKNIFKKGASGVVALTGGEINSGDLVSVAYDGTQFQLLNGTYTGVPTVVSPIQGDFKNLKGVWASTSTVTFTADQIIVQNSSNSASLLTSYSYTLSTGTSGAGGLDTGSTASSTWYYVWAIYGSGGTSILLSLSSTAPTMPSGYTYNARIGSLYLDGSKNIRGFIQYGRRTRYVFGNNLTTFPVLATGSNGNISTGPTVSVAVSGSVPATASTITLNGSINQGAILAAPNANYGGQYATTSAPPFAIYGSSGLAVPGSGTADVMLESTNIYVATSGTNYLFCLGYEDNL